MDPIPDTLTSMANTCEVCQYLHMCGYAYECVLIMLPLLLLAMLLEAIILVIARGANRSIVRWLRLWIHPRILPHQSQTHVKFISSCSSAVAVDAHVDMSLQHCCCSCWQWFWKIRLFWLLVITWGANRTIVWWLRLWTHPRWLPHQCQTHVKCISLSCTHAMDVHVDASLQSYPCLLYPAFGR
jgi:hypothetical protein